MILAIILFIIILLVIALLIVFLFFVLFPSIKLQDKTYDTDTFVFNPEQSVDIISYEETKVSDKKAFVLCNCNNETTLDEVKINNKYTCFTAKNIFHSKNDCSYACFGLGDCVKVCPQHAIYIYKGIAKISSLCCGCGKCVNICPQNIISLVEPKNIESLKCKNSESKTSCIKFNEEQTVSWPEKKDFKLWKACYKIYKKYFNK